MKSLQRFAQLSVGIGLVLTASVYAQQLTLAQAIDPTETSPADPHLLAQQATQTSSDSPKYRELDLLRRNGFSVAWEAAVSVRVFDKSGITPRNLQGTDFTLIVNGTPRIARLQAPGASIAPVVPLVLLTFPPNQPIVHSIGVHEAKKYFSSQPTELLPWKVGILDSNGKLTPFTDGRSQLLAYLDVVDHTTEPIQYSSDAGLPASFKWEGSWLTKAEEAIGAMQRFEGPKVIIAMNPLSEWMYGRNSQVFAQDGPESLTHVAQHIGAHIYIANVGGPDVFVPGGEAAEQHAAQINTGGTTPALGTSPSYHMQVDPQMTARLNYFAYRTSMMMQTAKDTLGGFSNSLSDLAGYIHRDLDENYSLTFDLTATDRDKGTPSVEVRLANHDQRVAILDVVPVGSVFDSDRKAVSREVMETVRRATKRPVSSPDFRISQHVDYFPVHVGLEPVLPMSCLIEWTGQGPSPRQLLIAESVEDTSLSTSVLDREIEANWSGRSISWEREGRLHPGHYIWRIAIHDATGKVFSSMEQKITIDYPRGASIAASSLVVGKSCHAENGAVGLRRHDAAGSHDADQMHTQVDPMRVAGCRLISESTDGFASTDMLHALVRIYPSEKLERNVPESWSARFILRSASGTIATERDMSFTVDSNSGYMAYVEMPLDIVTVHPGVYTLDVYMRGPGIRSDLKESRPIVISTPQSP